MVKHYNTSIIEDANRIFNTKSNDNLATEINPTIQPIIQISRYSNLTQSTSRTTQGNGLIQTSDSNKDTYITSAWLAFTSDSTSDSTGAYISITSDNDSRGTAVTLLEIAKTTLTANSSVVSISFPTPIKVKRNTVMNLVIPTQSVGTCSAKCAIFGYTVETTRGN